MSPLRRRLLSRVIVLVLLPLLPLLALTLYVGNDDRRDAAAAAKRSALRLAQAVSANQERLVEEARQLLTTLANDPRLRPKDVTACNLYVAETLQRWPRYANLGVIAPKGDIVCSALPAPPGISASDRLYFQQALATRTFAVGEYQIGRITGKATINFGYPLLDARGRVTAVVFSALDLKWLNALAGDANLPPGTAITLLDRSGTIFARYPDSEQWIGRSARKEPVVQAVLAGEKGTTEAEGLDGVERFYGFSPLPRSIGATPIYVTAGLPTAAALQPARQELERNLAVVAVLAVFAALVGWLGGQLLVTRPVARREKELTTRAAAVARFGERLALAGEEEALAKTVMTGMASASAADVGALYLVEGEDGALSLAATHRVDPERVAKHMAPGEGRAGRAVAERRPVATSDPESGVRLTTLGGELAIRHELYVPLLRNGRCLGVVELGRAQNGPFTPEVVELVGFLAAEAAPALSEANRPRR